MLTLCNSPPSKSSSYDSSHSLRRPPAYPQSPGGWVKLKENNLIGRPKNFKRSSPVLWWPSSTEGSCALRVPAQKRQRGEHHVEPRLFKIMWILKIVQNHVITQDCSKPCEYSGQSGQEQCGHSGRRQPDLWVVESGNRPRSSGVWQTLNLCLLKMILSQ